MKYTLLRGEDVSRATYDRNRTYKVRDIRHNTRTVPWEAVFFRDGVRNGFLYSAATTGGSPGGTSPTIWTGEREWLGIVIYRDDISILLAYFTARGARRACEGEKSIIMEYSYYAPRKTPPFFRRCFREVLPFFPLFPFLFSFSLPVSFLSFFSLFFFLIHRTRETLLSTFVIKVPNSSRAAGDTINLKKIINSNFSKTSRAFCPWKSSRVKVSKYLFLFFLSFCWGKLKYLRSVSEISSDNPFARPPKI